MTKNLDSIPYDVFYQVASTLDCHDYIHLSQVNRALNALTRGDSIARSTVRVRLRPRPPSLEANTDLNRHRAHFRIQRKGEKPIGPRLATAKPSAVCTTSRSPLQPLSLTQRRSWAMEAPSSTPGARCATFTMMKSGLSTCVVPAASSKF